MFGDGSKNHSPTVLLQPLVRPHYPAFTHLLALGSMHLILEGVVTSIELAHMTSARWMHLPMLMKSLFVFSSLLGITTVCLAYWAKRYPLTATSISVCLYILLAILFGLMFQRFPIPEPPHPEWIPPGRQMCLIVLMGVIASTLRAAIQQHRAMKQTDQ